MQMYVNYFNRNVKLDDENPTIGIILCKTKNDALVQLTLPEDANVYASRYQIYLPLKRRVEDEVDGVGRNNAGSPGGKMIRSIKRKGKVQSRPGL